MKSIPFGSAIFRSTGLVVSSGQVFIGGSLNDQADELTALCAANGHLMWRRVFPGGGLAISPGRDEVAAVAGTTAYGVAALTGDVRWRTEIGGRGHNWIVRAGGTILVSDFSGRVVALGAATGRTRWSTGLPGTDFLTVETSGDLVHLIARKSVERTIRGQGAGTARVMVPTDSEVRTVRAGTGRRRWSRDLPPLGSSALAAGGFLYLPAPDRLLALDAYTGKTVWQVRLPARNLSPELRLHDGVLLVNPTVTDGTGLYPLLALDPRTGVQRWRLGLRKLYSIGAVLPGRVFTHGVELTAIATGTGAEIWSSPVPKDSTLLVDGTLAYVYDVYTAQLDAYDIGTGGLLAD